MGFSDHLRESSQRVLSGSGDPPDLPEILRDDHPLENEKPGCFDHGKNVDIGDDELCQHV